MTERRVGDSAASGLVFEPVELRQQGVGIDLLRRLFFEPRGLVSLVVDFRVATNLTAVSLDLAQSGRRQDGAGQLVAVQGVVQVDFMDGRAVVSEGDGESGVPYFADASGR